MKKQITKALFCFTLFFLISSTIQGQTKAKKKEDEVRKYLKVYLETRYESKQSLIRLGGRTLSSQLKYFKIYPSIAFAKINSDGRLFEMSFALINLEQRNDLSENRIDSLSIRLPTRGAETFSLAIGSRFEWVWQLKKAETHQLYLGISANPIFSFENVIPFTTASFPSYQYDLTTGLSVVPRWCWQLTDRLLIDVNVPLTLTEIDLNYSYIGDPVLPTFARTQTKLTSKFVLKPQLRIGFGVRF
jgi:hypothetical protein